MSLQPLTNRNPEIVVIAVSQQQVQDELRNYNFELDGTGAIPPTVAARIYTTSVDFIVDPPDADLPCAMLAGANPVLVREAYAWCNNVMPMAKALSMRNNEYAIRRDQIQRNDVRDRTGTMPTGEE